jgi:hypothetical protein
MRSWKQRGFHQIEEMITYGRSGPGFVSPGAYDAIDRSAREHAARAARRTRGLARTRQVFGWMALHTSIAHAWRDAMVSISASS